MVDPRKTTLNPNNPRCDYCGGEVFWGMPRPDDPCFHCDRPIRKPRANPQVQDGES